MLGDYWTLVSLSLSVCVCVCVCFICFATETAPKLQNTEITKHRIGMINVKPHTLPIKACNHQVIRAGHQKAPHCSNAQDPPYNA